MKEKIKNNIGFKIMAAVFAIFLWWIVVNVDDPLDIKSYNVPVAVINPEVVTNAGKSFQVTDDTQSISVTVKARRKILAKIKTSNIIATADLGELQDSSVPIRIRIDGYEGMYEEAIANPRNIQVRVENTQKKTFPITTVATGAPRDGYVVGSMTSSPQTVDVSGPESTVSKINKVIARVDVSELSQDATVQTELFYYDAANDLIDKSQLTSNCDKNGATITVSIWKAREFALSFDTSEVKTAEGYVFTGIEVEPQTIKLAGTQEKLSSITKLEVGPKALKRDNLVANEEIVVEIAEYLPEGIVLADEAASNVVVRIMVEKAGTKSIQLPVRSVTVLNLSEKMQIEYGPEQEIELTFEGADEVLASLTVENIVASIDLQNYKEEGTYSIQVAVTELPLHCVYTGTATIQITLSKK